MSFKGFAFRTFFGGKPWYKSVTAWAQVALAVAETVPPALAAAGLADRELMSLLTAWVERAWAVATAIGIRRAVGTNGKAIAAVGLVALLSLGCGKLTFTTQAPGGPPVTVEASYASRGCISAVVDPVTGKVDIIHKQDGTSDWIMGRVLPTLGAMVLTGLSGLPLIGDISIPEPSGIGGCTGIMAGKLDTGEKPNGESVVYELVPTDDGDGDLETE